MLHPLPLNHYLKTFFRLGVGENDILANTGIDRRVADDPQCLVRMEQYCGVFENMARLDYPGGVGLEVGLSSELTQFGVLGRAAAVCDSARGSMEDLWMRFGGRMGMVAIPEIAEERGGTVTIAFSMPAMSEPAQRFCIEETLCNFLRMGERVSGERATFGQIQLAYPEPSYAHRYSEIFRCSVRFRAPCTAVVVDRSWFERPLATRDEALKDFYMHYLGRLEQQIRGRSSLPDRAREALLRCPARSLLSLPALAEQLDVSTRSLSRALKDEGTTYRDLVEEVRMLALSRSLEATRRSAKELAFEAGYRDVNAFRRAFKKWTGRTVGEYCAGQA